MQKTYSKIGCSASSVKERTGTVGYVSDSALRYEWQVGAHHTASPVGAFFSSSVALQVLHLVEFLQEVLTFISTDGSEIVQR